MSPHPELSYYMYSITNSPTDAAKISASSSTSANAPSSTSTTTTAHGTMHPTSTNTGKLTRVSVAIVNSSSIKNDTTDSSETCGSLTEYLQQSAGNWKLRSIMAAGRLSNYCCMSHMLSFRTYIYIIFMMSNLLHFFLRMHLMT